MKVEQRMLEVDSTLSGEVVGMTIDDSALMHIMSVLTDLYSDPELAVIREYSTNALDAHATAGVKRPIDVTLPSALSPFFRVRDYGYGLNADDIRNIYSRYGTSTKRDSNDVVGMLGLGCKSALTYTDQFTITGYKDDVATMVSVSRDEDGAGSMTIVSEHACDESGVEIVVPAKRINAFESKAQDFFRFWEPGTVHVNGVQPKRVDGRWIDKHLLYTSETEQDYVVMGNVAYPADLDQLDNNRGGYRSWNAKQWHRVAFVPIGAVAFTPSREALQVTRKTGETIAALRDEFQAKLDASLTKQIANAANAREAMHAWKDAVQIGLRAVPQYKGRDVTGVLKRTSTDPDMRDCFLIGHPHGGYGGRKSGEWYNAVTLMDSYGREFDYVWITGWEGVELTKTKRDKMDQWFTNQGLTPPKQVVCVKELTPDEKFWLTGSKVYPWAPIEAEKLPKTVTAPDGSTRPKGSYKGRKAGSQDWYKRIPADEIDTTKTIVYLNGNEYTGQQDYVVKNVLDSDVTVICLEANRIEKFKRDFPTAVTPVDAATTLAKAWIKTVDKTDLAAAKLQHEYGNEARLLARMDESRILDPKLQEAIKLSKRRVAVVQNQISKFRHYIELGVTKNPLDPYPLILPRTHPGVHEHFYIYLNAAYRAENGASA